MKLGFIGCGNMAAAMMKGIISNGILQPEEIIGADVSTETLAKVQKDLGVQAASDNTEVVKKANVIVLSVKPQFYKEVIHEIKQTVSDNQFIITLAPGKTLAWLEDKFGKQVKLIRTMPNTPAMVQEGITAVCPNANVTEDELRYCCEILKGFGDVEVIPEKLIDAEMAIAGSSPAYVYMMIEALADGAVAEGMPRAQAYKFAAKAVMGSAKMVLETGKHPGELKDMVCSPGGTTIAAVKVLEEAGFRSALIEAVEACAAKSKEL